MSIKIFKKVVEVLKEIVDEAANFSLDSKGFGIVVQDPSHISLIDFSIPKAYFSNFNIKKKTKLGLNIANLNRVLKKLDDTALIAKLDSKEHKLHFEFGGEIKHKLSLNLIDLAAETYPEPQEKFTATIEFANPEVLKKALEQVALFSDHVKLCAKTETFEVFGKGDNGEFLVTIPVDAEGVEFDVKEKSVTMYPLSYLLNIMKLAPVTERLIVRFSEDMPIILEFVLHEEYNIVLKYALAPRVEEEENFEINADEDQEELPDEEEDLEEDGS